MREIPYSSKPVLQFPLLLCVVAVFIYAFAYISFRNNGRLPITRFLAHVFAVLGIAAGFQQLWNLINPDTGFLYRQAIKADPKIVYAHYAAPLIPAILLIVFFIIDARMRKVAREESLEDTDDDSYKPKPEKRSRFRRPKKDEFDDDF